MGSRRTKDEVDLSRQSMNANRSTPFQFGLAAVFAIVTLAACGAWLATPAGEFLRMLLVVWGGLTVTFLTLFWGGVAFVTGVRWMFNLFTKDRL
jgi:hypothetical protein